jgi:signal peptidase I
MNSANGIRQFFLPRLNRKFLVRVSLVALSAVLLFGLVLRPMWIRGESMSPTYEDGSLNFCFRQRYLFSQPKVGDVVAVKMAGTNVMLLKRIVAAAGQTVEFRNGQLFVDGEQRDEPYVTSGCDWELPPRQVKPGYVYVIGDNRGMPQSRHLFGQTPITRLAGGPLW